MDKREYGVDLFRTIATVFVVILHVLEQGGILSNAFPGGVNYWVAWFIEIIAFCAVNCFALISGYVMAGRKTKLKNIIGLWFQVFFYSIVISLLFFILVPDTRSITKLAVAFLPVMGMRWWYISSYFALFFFIPILNTAIEHISKKTFEKVLIIILIGVCVIDRILPLDTFVFAGGYSPIWLIVLYLFGAYIKKYDVKQKITSLKSIVAFGAVVILTFLSKFIITFATKNIFGEARFDNTFISYTSITIVLASIFLFLFCLNVKISNFSEKLIAFFAPATLGVYLIHVHPFVFQYIIKDAFAMLAQKHFIIMIIGIVIATLLIFLICAIIDLIRIQIFKLIRIGKLSEIIDNKIDKISSKVLK